MANKKSEEAYLHIVDGWLGYEKRSGGPVGRAVLYQRPGCAWSEWLVQRTGSDDRFQYAIECHGKDPSNKIEPPAQIPVPIWKDQKA
jgi:hypothetical protein